MIHKKNVSIIIRAKNEAALIGQCLTNIYSQNYAAPVDVLVIDSGSRDGTVAIARSFPAVRVLEIPPAEFNYGATLNRGVDLTNGTYVIALSAHCVPADNGWLDALTRPLDDDHNIAGTFGRQVPWPWCDLYESTILSHTFGPDDKIYEGIREHARMTSAIFSNANSCFRRQAVQANPFRPLAWAEDRVWAYEMLSSGWKIGYVAKAATFHSHRRSTIDYFQVGRADGRMMRQLGYPAVRLVEQDWCGFRKLYWRCLHWHTRAQVAPRLSRCRHAFAALCSEIASGVGSWVGQRN